MSPAPVCYRHILTKTPTSATSSDLIQTPLLSCSIFLLAFLFGCCSFNNSTSSLEKTKGHGDFQEPERYLFEPLSPKADNEQSAKRVNRAQNTQTHITHNKNNNQTCTLLILFYFPTKSNKHGCPPLPSRQQ